jgi:hypothetical protein
MRITFEIRGPVEGPYLRVHQENVLGMLLRPLMAAYDGAGGESEQRPQYKIVDGRLSALVAAVNKERIAQFNVLYR